MEEYKNQEEKKEAAPIESNKTIGGGLTSKPRAVRIRKVTLKVRGFEDKKE